jgi:hypothetical protein
MLAPQSRFLNKVERIPECGCWLWTAAAGKGSAIEYGAFRFNGRVELAHRASYMMFVGEIPEGHEVCHTCDVGLCVNPYHLFTSSHLGNMRDCAKKGRAVPSGMQGEGHTNSIFTEEQVLQIYREYHGGGVSQRILAARFGCSRGAIVEIGEGRNWAHLTQKSPQ